MLPYERFLQRFDPAPGLPLVAATVRVWGLRKQGTTSTTNDFGVNGMAATSSPGVEAYVDGLNPAGGGTLLISATSGFTEYAFAFVDQEADFVEDRDLARATALRLRAKALYQRARDYGFRGLEVDIPRFREALRENPDQTLSRARKKHVPLLYWTALAWAAAISLAKDDAELSADQHLVEAMMKRALALDEGFERGTIHDFFIAYEGGRKSVGGSLESAREHFERALVLAHGARVSPFVTFAETVSVAAQDRREFERILGQALAVDAQRVEDTRLVNLVYQKRARWLLSRADELFIE